MPQYDAVIFDLDGVVIDSIRTIEAAFAVAYREVVGGGPPPFEEYRRHFGLSFPVIMKIMGLPADLHGPFIRESNKRIGDIHVHQGMPELLNDLRRTGIYCGVATGKDGKRARHVLDCLNLLNHFDLVLGSDDVDNPKPAPDMALRHLKESGVRASRALMVGDAVADLRCGRSAGTQVAAALWGETSADLLNSEKPDHILRSPAELKVLLEAGAVLETVAGLA